MQDNTFLKLKLNFGLIDFKQNCPSFWSQALTINEKISLKCNLSKSCSKFHASRQFHGVYDVSISKTIQNHRQKKLLKSTFYHHSWAKKDHCYYNVPIPSYLADPCPTLTECNVGNKEKSQSHEKGEKSVLREWFSVKPIFFSLSHTIIFLSRGGRGILRQDKIFSGNNKWRAK